MASGVDQKGVLKLEKLTKKIEAAGLGGSDFRDFVSKRLGATAIKLADDTFRLHRDPYNEPWAPLRYRKGEPLQKTGGLRAAFHYILDPRGFRLRNAKRYFWPHQTGATLGRRTTRERFQPVNAAGRFSKKGERVKVGGRTVERGVILYARSYIGGGKIPRRAMVPDARRGLGIWAKPLEAAGSRAVRDWIKR